MPALATGPLETGDERADGALGAVLTAAQKEAGFWLAEDEDFVYLYRHRKLVAVFSAHAATIEAMRQEVARHGDNGLREERADG